jgi:hypothetical protein
MNELEQVLIGDSAAAALAVILEGLVSELAHRQWQALRTRFTRSFGILLSGSS